MPFEHPILESNMIDAFPDVDLTNLPPTFAKFVRIEPPVIGPYEVFVGTTYKSDENGVFYDAHYIRPMTDLEKTQKQQDVISSWASTGGFPSWVFDASTCQMKAPVPRPDDGETYFWDESLLSWVIYKANG